MKKPTVHIKAVEDNNFIFGHIGYKLNLNANYYARRQ